ncbi:hypothetical protein [Endozoicomonas numazuensis]|uniref:Lipoprotein n=1 Tax=Endozoicomonas numazuensis TaxID=1137799 RepID=A0A081NDI7_9GAMM|nr:hypothetical protein [Endozoicomonas numazuensis]KEQ16510.1 hypothetical protein GZ78_21915 [Endozoicomonas numazuensis]
MSLKTPTLLLLALLLGGCSTLGWKVGDMGKIQFDLNEINKEGLRGSGDNMRAVSYEFCIPDKIEHVDQVMAIDPTLVVYRDSPGKIRCRTDEYLAIGDTKQLDYYEVLRKLAELDYVKSIQEATFE